MCMLNWVHQYKTPSGEKTGSNKIFTKLHNGTIPTPHHFTSPNTYLVEMNMTPHFTT